MARDVNWSDSITNMDNNVYEEQLAPPIGPTINPVAILDRNILNKLTKDIRHYSPYITGHYYIHMVNGSWLDGYNNLMVQNAELPRINPDMATIFKSNFPTSALDIDLPTISVESETTSTRNKNLSYATKVTHESQFTIKAMETSDLLVQLYHEAWIKYIELLRRGHIDMDTKTTNSMKTIEVPYFNAVWVAMFKPFSTEIVSLVKIMGVQPVQNPIKENVGNRSKGELSVLNLSYKCNDVITATFNNSESRNKSPFYQEFLTELNGT